VGDSHAADTIQKGRISKGVMGTTGICCHLNQITNREGPVSRGTTYNIITDNNPFDVL